jgi:hypothetical protein
VTRQPRAFFALDLGSATTSASLVGYLGGRWRLIAHAAAPVSADLSALLTAVLDGVGRADPEMMAGLSGSASYEAASLAATLPRLEARSTPSRRLAVLAGSPRQQQQLQAVAMRAGWLVVGGNADDDDQLRLAGLAHSPDTHAVLLGADDVPAGDERRHLPMLAALLGAAARCRPELMVVLAGGAALHEPAFWAGAGEGTAGPAGQPAETAVGEGASESPPAAGRDGLAGTTGLGAGNRSGHILVAPDALAGRPDGAALQQVLEGLRALPNDSRLGVARSIASLAAVLDRSIEGIEVGLNGALRCRAEPHGQDHGQVSSSRGSAGGASLAPQDVTDEVLESVLAWSTAGLDRYRLTDRLRDLRQVPWGEVDGEGAQFRLAAAKAAIERVVAATPEITAGPMPDLLVAAGGVWSGVPPAIVGLTLADLVRRPGVSQVAVDRARLLGPLGAIEDEAERRRMLADLADDLLVPVGALIVPAGMKAGRAAGRMVIRRIATEAGEAPVGAAEDASVAPGPSSSDDTIGEIELQPGKLEILALPPGRRVTVEMDFRDTVSLGGRGRHFVVEISGGLGGLLLDLRDVPLRLPDRPEPRRAALESWQRMAWAGLDE